MVEFKKLDKKLRLVPGSTKEHILNVAEKLQFDTKTAGASYANFSFSIAKAMSRPKQRGHFD